MASVSAINKPLCRATNKIPKIKRAISVSRSWLNIAFLKVRCFSSSSRLSMSAISLENIALPATMAPAAARLLNITDSENTLLDVLKYWLISLEKVRTMVRNERLLIRRMVYDTLSELARLLVLFMLSEDI